MAIPKILCHEDGVIFAVWHPAGPEKFPVYCTYFCEEDVPPRPETLGIEGASPVVDIASLVWRPVKVAVAPPVEYIEEIGPHEDV